jgi:hypothetical protein
MVRVRVGARVGVRVGVRVRVRVRVGVRVGVGATRCGAAAHVDVEQLIGVRQLPNRGGPVERRA